MKTKTKEKPCIACCELNCKQIDGWNHRVVATYEKKWKKWEYSIREVHYKKCKIAGWSTEPTRLICGDNANEMYEEINMIERAFSKPLLIEGIEKDKLVEYHRSAIFVKDHYLKQFIK